ncbi:interferon-related developmental regulator-domain-containing protein [Mycotypha africana]|uniref:interferon-related developmental regulator-domain-containing protein n=1 Tax=Mycotypha africana TaxID=64632 RepID=UPI002300C989|nr:interferon-related developmental regulator-domain-containing protein [Mycotypha africana]KAI8984459.1 interferon-related developmental regulator-domain-containing protein [Mycotypha africana]
MRDRRTALHSVKRSAKSSSKRYVSTEDAQISNWVDQLNQALDDLSESRTSTREHSLETLVNCFACHNVSSQIEHRLLEVLALLKKSLTKNASIKEACLAAKGIALTFINMDDISESDGDDLYRKILPSLRNTIKDSDDIEIKISCLQTLSLITYIAASDIDKLLVRNYLFDLIETDGADFNVENFTSHELDKLFCEAVHAYGLLFAASFSMGFVNFEVLWEEVEKVMPVHELLLESSDKDVRIAAGENVGLIFETVNIFATSDDEEDDDELDEEQTSDAEDSGKPEYDNMDGLIRTLKDLSVDSSRRRAKSDRAEQKSVFRDIVQSVEENVKPIEELKIGGRVLTFRGWAKILPLNCFRKILGQGFQYHLKTNPMMSSIFHYSTGGPHYYDSDSDDDTSFDISELSNVDKKYLFEENKKSRTKHLRNARLGKENPPVY